MIQYKHGIENKKPDIVFIEKERRLCWIIDVVHPDYNKLSNTEKRKVDRYDQSESVTDKNFSSKGKLYYFPEDGATRVFVFVHIHSDAYCSSHKVSQKSQRVTKCVLYFTLFPTK